MKKIYIYCEGQTEESFINKVLYPYFLNKQIIVQPIICQNKPNSSREYKGGVSSYLKIKNELIKLTNTHKKHAYVTTMFDYYGMPQDTPAIDYKDSQLDKQIAVIEDAINKDINIYPNFFFHFNLHEFEALLFSNPDEFSVICTDEQVSRLNEIRNQYSTPEYINNSVATAPSKRILSVIPRYSKVKNGSLISQNIGIDRIMKECPHFCEWVKKIESLPELTAPRI